MMDARWKTRFFAVMGRCDPQQEAEFLSLVDQANGRCSLETAKDLLKSFSSAPDFGTQERVISALASADKADAVTAILEELPRLVEEAPEWAEVLIGQEVDRRPELLVRLALASSAQVRDMLRLLVENPDFVDMYPNAKKVAEQL